MAEETIDYGEVVKRNGIAYKKFTNDPFSGEVSGQISGTFLNGLLEGVCEHCHSNGQPFKKGNYQNGLEEGKWIIYHKNGQLHSEGHYVNGKKEGQWVEYQSNGVLLSQALYTDGLSPEGSKIPGWKSSGVKEHNQYSLDGFNYWIPWVIAAFFNFLLQGALIPSSYWIFAGIGTDPITNPYNGADFFLKAVVLTSVLSIPITSGLFILTFNLYKDLNFKNVMPWVYVSGSSDFIIKAVIFLLLSQDLRIETLHKWILFFIIVTAFVVSMSLIRSYFIKKPDRWY
jgi:hypothetical protein